MKARRIKKLDPDAPLRANAALIVGVRLDELCAFAERALDPGAASTQHDTRIAAKRLRYVLEITQGCFGAEAEAARIAARELQEVLGEIHDCDVMLPRTKGIESLEGELQIRREQLFRRFCGVWQIEMARGTWAALERRLHSSTPSAGIPSPRDLELSLS